MKHETPSDEIFNEIRAAAVAIWNEKDNTYGYVDKKLSIIKNITNYEDNVMVCYRMFDDNNQRHMRFELSEEALQYIDANE